MLSLTDCKTLFPVQFGPLVTRSGRTTPDQRLHLHDYTQAHIPAEIPLQHIVAHGTIYEEILKAARQQSVDQLVMVRLQEWCAPKR